ncbi:hypothetical protein [Streptomyces sp. S186]|uniref:hypothetical protein n=1 Tax=Streptomyces sp. S186 TaxID=3434395 RepID=UPI003F6711F5
MSAAWKSLWASSAAPNSSSSTTPPPASTPKGRMVAVDTPARLGGRRTLEDIYLDLIGQHA